VLQFSQNLVAALLVAQQAVMVLLLARWRTWSFRLALLAWLGFEIVSRSVMMGARTSLVLLLLTAGILYHRLVKPLRFGVLALGGTVLVTGFLVLGVIRNGQSVAPTDLPGNVFLASNEFQSLFVTAFDLNKMNEAGTLRVPWQVYVSDAYLCIPSQVLPFDKIDPASWYIDVIGQTGMGNGYMFGALSQTVVGLGWIELVLRGIALAACFAWLHRWYVRRAVYFWPTVFYLFVCIWAYYTFRSTTFYIVYFILYRFVPVFVAAQALEALLSRARRSGPLVRAVPA